jgi:hypothetical protein
MQVNQVSPSHAGPGLVERPETTAGKLRANAKDDQELRDAFQSFVGETLFRQTLKSMRQTVGKPAYFHGGRAEEVFQEQLDEVLAEKMSRASSDKLSGPMYELFRMGRK